MKLYQNHVVFRSFSDLYVEEIRQEEIRSNKSANSSTTSSRAGSFSEESGIPPMIPYGGYNLSRNSTKSSSSSSRTTSTSQAAEYYPAALYNSKMAQRESDTVTLDDDASITRTQDLSLRRF